jgi:hypothetical protein
MKKKRLRQIQNEIKRIQRELQEIGDMRPGSLTQQYRIPKDKIGPYYQLSYTHKMKSHTEYIRPMFIEEIREQIVANKRLKKLVEKWIELGIEQSKLKMDIDKNSKEM